MKPAFAVERNIEYNTPRMGEGAIRRASSHPKNKFASSFNLIKTDSEVTRSRVFFSLSSRELFSQNTFWKEK